MNALIRRDDPIRVILVFMILSQHDAERVAETMRALASPSRLRILARLDETPRTVGQLEDELGIAQATVSNHLRILRHLDLVAGERDGRSVTYRISDEHVSELLRQAAHHVGHGEAPTALPSEALDPKR